MSLACGSPAAEAAAKTVILVHGAFSDGSIWDQVIPRLQAKGLKVVAVQNPLSSLADDVAATHRAIAAQSGPVLLVGHSWGGVVITEAGADPKVAGLVYVTALAPDDGESVNDLAGKYKKPPGFEQIKADTFGFLALTEKGIAEDLDEHLPPAAVPVIAAKETPTAARCFSDKISHAAWKDKPSWFIVGAQDRLVAPELQRFMAARMKATVSTLAGGHIPIIMKPADVVAVIIEAAEKAETP